MKYVVSGFVESSTADLLEMTNFDDVYNVARGRLTATVRTRAGTHEIPWELRRDPVLGERITITFEVDE